jgi:hydroxyethylthiazole kinase-like sugar kinase family protein
MFVKALLLVITLTGCMGAAVILFLVSGKHADALKAAEEGIALIAKTGADITVAKENVILIAKSAIVIAFVARILEVVAIGVCIYAVSRLTS